MPQEFHKNQCQIEMIIKNGNINELQNLVEQIQENEEKSEEINHNSCQQIPNLVISACRNNKIEILKYLLTNDGEVLYQIYAKKNHIPSPDDTDKWQHNAFYYSIRSSNIELLDTLITAWPGSVLSDNNSEMLEEILSKAYEEIRLKNILLSDEMKIFVESQLIDIHFLSDNNKISSKKEPVIDKIKERISFILEKITLLNEEFAANDYEINERFLFIAKCIAQNIFVLKNQLKSTYAILPWEEIEFCLICFISLHKTQHEINIFYHFTLSKTKLLRYLKFFAEKLHKIEMTHLQTTEIREIAKRPNLSRDEVIAKILEKCPEFIELYDDYERIRDIHSLTKMNEYIKLSRDIDSKQKEGQLVLIRTFQILGEYFKNTLESPKLSNTTSILLLFSLSNETKKIITKLRDSLAHSNSLLQRTNMERNNDVKFFIGIQNDCKKLGGLIANILHKKKMYLITMFFNELVISNNYPDGIREISKTLSNCFNLEDIEVDNFGNENHEKIEKLFAELRSSIVFSTNFETEMFARVYDLINFDKKKNDNSRKLYKEACFAFKKLHHVCVEDKYKIINIKEIDNVIRKLIFDITDHKEASEFKIIGLYSSIILDLCKSRMQNDEQKLSELHTLINDIKFIAYSGKNCVKFIKELEQKLNQKLAPIKKDNKKNNFSLTDVKFKEDLLKQKLQELKNKLEKNVGIENITKINPCYRSNKKLQVIVELLVLDILTILCETKTCFSENNILSLIENSPLLTGRNLRNHLAHYNVLVDLFQSDPPLSIVLNANKLITENLIDNKKITGKIYQEDLAKNKKNYNWGLETVENQIAMFKTLQDGNFDDFLSCLENGSDVFARCGRMRTTLHYAAIGGCLQIVKYLYNQNVPANARDLDSKTAVHFAAEYGRTDVVEYFQGKQINFMYEKTEFKEKPLHLVAQKSHKDTVEVLLGKKSNAENVKKLNSLHLAAIIGNLNVVNYLLENRGNFKINSIDMHGKTPLHWAAQGGHLVIVNILIENKANVNSTDDDGCAPLHYAAENGHNKIFNALIKHGAKINAVDVNKFTPLHYAVKNKNEEIVNICLNRHANADLRTSKGWTPLHYAIALGNLNIINVLLEHGVNTNCKDQKGYTPLHILSGFEFSFNKEVVQLLLNNGAVINVKDSSMCTPLHLSSMLGNIEVIESLVTNGANINALDRDNETPLHKAAFEGKLKAIEILVKNKAFVNNKNKTGLTPLYFAASNGCCDSLEYLLANKAQEDKSIWPNLTALGAAIANGHNNSVKLLLKHRSQINDRGLMDGSMLSLATNVGNFETVQILIEHGVNVNPTGMGEKSPLCEAIKLNHMKIVKLLVSKGANVNGEHGEPIYSAIFNGHVDILEYLVNKDPSIITNSSGKNLLNIAVSRDHVEIVSALIRYGVDVNGNVNNIDINKTTSPLFLALKKDHIEIIKILVENGANINQKNIDGTPLHLAVCKNNLECVKLMIKSGMAELNAKAKDNYTILHIAAENGYLEMVKYLFENGSDIHARTSSDGSKAIHLAVMHGYLSIVEFLLKSGSCVNETNLMNQTLLHNASRCGHLEVAKYLISKNACINAQDLLIMIPIHYAARNDHKNIVELLLQNGSMHDAMTIANHTPLDLAFNLEIISLLILNANLFEAVKENNSTNVKNSLKRGAVINSKNNEGLTALNYALKLHHFDIVKMLLIHGASYDSSNDSPLSSIDSTKHIDIVELLQKATKQVNKGNMETLIPPVADYGIKPDLVKFNIKEDKIEYINHKRSKWLQQQKILTAVTTGDEQTLKELISCGTNVNEERPDGMTLLHYAVYNEHTNIVNILLGNGANVVQVTNEGNTPLHTAVLKNNKEIVDILLRHTKRSELKELVNIKTTTSGSTALHVAVANNGSLGIVKLLLKFGAGYDAPNQKGEIPFELTTDEHVKSLLKRIKDLFNYIERGNSKALNILKKLNYEEFAIATNSRNNQGSTLFQIAIAHENKTLAKHLSNLLKIRNKNRDKISEMSKISQIISNCHEFP